MKKHKGIRYGFRPKSYWAETDPLSAILSNVTGENCRQMISDYWASGRIAELDISILQDEVDDNTRTNPDLYDAWLIRCLQARKENAEKGEAV